jgi:hypothetical protein
MFPNAGDHVNLDRFNRRPTIRFDDASVAETGDEHTFARILLRRHF